MGMAASQARLLSITARLTDNENSGQRLSFNKIDLANRTEQLNADYNEALNQTKLTVLTGFNGSEEVYTDLSFNTLTGYNKIAGGKQYCVIDTKGQILVDEKIAEAFTAAGGNYNVFLAELGYTQADITANITSTDESAKNTSVKMIHEAWDKYLNSIGKSLNDVFTLHPEGELTETSFNYKFFDAADKSILAGYPVVSIEEQTVTRTETDYTKPIAWEKKAVDMGANTTLQTPSTANDGNINPLANMNDMQNIVAATGLGTDDLEVTSWEDKVSGQTLNGIQIKTLAGFEAIMAQFATNPTALQQNYILAADDGSAINIDLAGSVLAGNWGGISQFQGLFDGNGSTISNMSGTQGMFSDLYGQVQNLNLDNVSISAETDCIGGMAGYLADGAQIINCNITNLDLTCTLKDQVYNQGYSAQNAAIGGMVGRNDGDISNSLVQGTINVPNATDAFSGIGGFIGLNANKDYQGSTVTNSVADVDIVLGGDSFTGGINNFVGMDINEMLITNCAATGNITGSGNVQLIDLAGYGMGLESNTINSIAYNPQTGEYVYWSDSTDPSYANGTVIDNMTPEELQEFLNAQDNGQNVWINTGEDYDNTTNQADLKNNAGLALNLNGLQQVTGVQYVDDLTKPIAWEQKTVTETIAAQDYILNFEGTTDEQREMYDYAVAITAQYFSENQAYNGEILKTAAYAENIPYINYLKNIFNKMSTNGWFTYTADADKLSPTNNSDYKHYLYSTAGVNNNGTAVSKDPIADSKVLEEMLRSGALLLETYSSKEGKFVTTTLSDDACIQEVEDERAIALVESKYTTDMLQLENEDSKIDLQLKKLDTEHTALQTEYDSLKNVIDKNIEKTFNMFS